MRKSKQSKYARYFKEIERLYVQEGLSQRQIGEQLGIGKEAVHHVFRRYLTHVDTNRTLYDYSDVYRKYKLNSHYFDTIDTSDKAYFLGLIYADGYIPNNGLYITLEPNDKYILESFCKYIKLDTTAIKDVLIKNTYGLSKIYPRLFVCSKYIAEKLHEIGAIQAKSLVLQPPIGVPEKLKPDFIRGFFDGNGSIFYDKSTGHYKIQFSTTYAMCEWLEEYFNFGTKILFQKKICRYGCSGNNKVVSALNKLYNNSIQGLRLERKYQKYLDCLKKKEYQDKHRKETWIKNLGPYIRNNTSGDCELSNQ